MSSVPPRTVKDGEAAVASGQCPGITIPGASTETAKNGPTVVEDVVFDIAEELPSVVLKGREEKHSMPSLLGIGCRADGVSSRFSHHLEESPIPADVLKSRRRFMQEYNIVVEKIKNLQSIKARHKVNASFTPKRLKEAKKTEKQIRKMKDSILCRDIPLLRRAANGSSHLCSFSRPLDHQEMEKRIDMIVDLKTWMEEDVLIDFDEGDIAMAVDITVDVSDRPQHVTEAEQPTPLETRSTEKTQTQIQEESHLEGMIEQDIAAALHVAEGVTGGESFVDHDISLNDSMVSMTAREPKIYSRRASTRMQKPQAAQHTKHCEKDSISIPPEFPSQVQVASLIADGLEMGEEHQCDDEEWEIRDEFNPCINMASSGSSTYRCSPVEAERPAHESSRDQIAVCASATNMNEHRQCSDGVLAGEEPAKLPADRTTADELEVSATGDDSEVLRQQIDDTVAYEAAQRAEALEETRRESQRVRSELRRKKQAMQSRQSARWENAEGGGETPRCVRKLQEHNDDPQGFIDMIYHEYPPKDGKQKHDRGNLKKTVQRAISHYHPDKQDEEAHGGNWLAICDEICKELTRIYVKL